MFVGDLIGMCLCVCVGDLYKYVCVCVEDLYRYVFVCVSVLEIYIGIF